MKRFSITLLFAFMIFNSKAQHLQEIHIVGEAKKMILPDVAIFELKMESTEKTETESFRKLTDLSQEVLKRLKADSFTEQQIKLTDFSVNKNEYILKNKEKKITYSSYQSLIVKFPIDKKKILNTYSDLTANTIKGLSISSSTECSDSLKKRIQKELIVIALNDAWEKADLIAKSTGYYISSVEQIGYKTNYDNNYTKAEMVKFTAPTIVKDEFEFKEVNKPEVQTSLSFFSINEIEFSEEIKVSYSISKSN